MIELHDGRCKPFTVVRGAERDSTPWDLPPNGPSATFVRASVAGWRFENFTYDSEGIRSIGLFQPVAAGESPFPAGFYTLAPAKCDKRMEDAGRFGYGILTSTNPFPHETPSPGCTCGFRVVRDLPTISAYLGELGGTAPFLAQTRRAARNSPYRNRSVGMAFVAVRGTGRACPAVQLPGKMRDPDRTLRVRHVAAEPVVIIEDPASAPLFHRMGVTTHVVDSLTSLHDPHPNRPKPKGN